MENDVRRSRSPKFPSHSIEESISYASKVYDAVHMTPVDSLTILRLMGFAGKSGASAAALGSVRQYGLVEGIGDNTRISEFALKILEPENEREKSDAIFEATRKPGVFVSILERFQNRIPAADEPVRAYLIRELGFSKKGADNCLKSLRQSLSFAGKEDSPIQGQLLEQAIGQPNAHIRVLDSQLEERAANDDPHNSREDVERKNIQIPLTKDCEATLVLKGEVTEKAVENLLKHIGLMKDIWTEDE